MTKGNSMKVKLPVKIPDIVIILLAIGITGVSAFTVYMKPKVTIQVFIQGSSQRWIFPLDAEETIAVRGPLGTTMVHIHNNEVWVESSPCTNKICMGMGHIDSKWDWIACLPNNVFIVIEGSDDIEELIDSAAW